MDLATPYRDKSPSLPSKLALSGIHLAFVLFALWLLFGGGTATVDGILGLDHQQGSLLRRAILAFAAAFYFLRTLATLFVFSRRRMPWSEAATIAVWIGVIDFLFAYLGGRNLAPMGGWEIAGCTLLAAGSLIHTGSEWQRHVWKQRPGNHGHLLTSGFWSLSRHVNYSADVVLFGGWTLVTGRPALLVVPAIMICLFAFVNIPAQDGYLAERYGEEYQAYASKTARLIPYIY